MNERIRELATEVGISVEYLTNTKQIVLIEKFAELIILECARIVEEDGSSVLSLVIKKYFGISDEVQ